MITKKFGINGNDYEVVLTDQIITHVNTLKNLYETTSEDPESFEQVSVEISAAVAEIATAIKPPATDEDLDGIIQEIIKAVDSKAAAVEQERMRSTSKKH